MTTDLSADFQIEHHDGWAVLRLTSGDDTNRLTRIRIGALIAIFEKMGRNPKPVIITGNGRYFSVGADLNEIAKLTGPDAYEFSRMGQALMNAIANFPAPIVAAVEGHCMGGGLDLALACHRRVAAPEAVFGHRGAALGLITGWGGTQRLPRLIGKGQALRILLAAEKITAPEALELGLVDVVSDNPQALVLRTIEAKYQDCPGN
jgi:enoyl-CoA hydratase/carnithine racemase